jgi:hypothetical protein
MDEDHGGGLLVASSDDKMCFTVLAMWFPYALGGFLVSLLAGRTMTPDH